MGNKTPRQVGASKIEAVSDSVDVKPLVDSATIRMAENKEVQYLICLNSLKITNTAPGNYTIPAGIKFKLVSSAEGIDYT